MKVAAVEPTGGKELAGDLRVPLAATVQRKELQVEWIWGQCKEKEATGAVDRHDIQYNNTTDGLATIAARLPQDTVFTSAASISIAGG